MAGPNVSTYLKKGLYPLQFALKAELSLIIDSMVNRDVVIVDITGAFSILWKQDEIGDVHQLEQL